MKQWPKHTFPPLHPIEQHKETAARNLKYIDYKCKALIYAFCVVGNCLTPPTVTERKWSKVVEMFLINHDMHQSLCELLNTK